MISNFTIFFYLSNTYFHFLCNKCKRFLHFHMIPAAPFLINCFFLFKVIFIACSLKNSQYFFIKFLPLYISCLFFMLLYEDIVCIEKPDGICALNFVVDDFSRLLLHPSIFSIIHSGSV